MDENLQQSQVNSILQSAGYSADTIPPQPRPNGAPEPQKANEQRVLRTFESDIAEAIRSKQLTQASIVIAETKKKHEQAEDVAEKKQSSNALKNVLIVLLSIALIAGGCYGAYYLYTISPLGNINLLSQIPTNINQGQTPTKAIPQGIIKADIQKVVDITSINAATIVKKITDIENQSKATLGQVTEIVIAKTGTSNNDTSTSPTMERVVPSEFAARLNINLPDSLSRSLDSAWMLGFITEANQEPFIIFKTTFFDSSFAGMLKWESSMPNDISGIFQITQSEPASVSTPITDATSSKTIASSTITPIQIQKITPQTYGLKGHFVDKTIKNKDVREFVDQTNTPLFVYSFVNNTTIVITKNEDTLGTIIDQIEKQNYVR